MTWKEFLIKVNCTEEEYIKFSVEKIEVKRPDSRAFVSLSARPGKLILEEFLTILKTDGMFLDVILHHFPLEKDRIKEICLIAVKQNGFAVQDVLIQTPEICIAAVKQNKKALGFVNKNIFDK